MADEETGPEATIDVAAILETRKAREEGDAARREAWLADRAAQAELEVRRAAARKRIRAAAFSGKAADPADVALSLGDE